MMSDTVIPPPTQQLARFRMSRLSEAVHNIGQTTQMFHGAVDAALTQQNPATIQQLSKTFIAAYRTFSESLESAHASRTVSDVTADVLKDILVQLKTGYADGLATLRADTDRLQAHNIQTFQDFCSAVNDKIDRLEQFWKTIDLPHGPQFNRANHQGASF